MNLLDCTQSTSTCVSNGRSNGRAVAEIDELGTTMCVLYEGTGERGGNSKNFFGSDYLGAGEDVVGKVLSVSKNVEPPLTI